MAVAYKVYDNNNKFIDVFGKEQLCDFATEQICRYKDTVYTKADVVNRTSVTESNEIDKIKKIIRKVLKCNEYVGNVEQSRLVLRVQKYRVKEIELY